MYSLFRFLYRRLCDPKLEMRLKLHKQQSNNPQIQQQQLNKAQVLVELKNNSINWNENDRTLMSGNFTKNDETTSAFNASAAISGNDGSVKKQKAKNPYKWITEDFEDKNLDKVKRTLLIALDDISKGYSKCCFHFLGLFLMSSMRVKNQYFSH